MIYYAILFKVTLFKFNMVCPICTEELSASEITVQCAVCVAKGNVLCLCRFECTKAAATNFGNKSTAWII